MDSDDMEIGAVSPLTPMTAEVAAEAHQDATSKVIVVETLNAFEGATVEEKVDDCVKKLPVVVVTNTWCPFSKDVKHFLSVQLEVTIHVIHINEIEGGNAIFKHLSTEETHKTVPMVYVRGKFLGGCDTLKALHDKGDLEKNYLHGLIGRQRTEGTETLETSKLLPPVRGQAIMPFFWFPNVVNNNVVRMTGLQVFIMAVISCAFFNKLWGRYIAVGLLVDFCLRLIAGSSVSPLGMIATVITAFRRPDFRPGPPKQFAAFCGVFFSMMASLFYFVDFSGHEIVGAVFIGMLAGASGMEAFLDFCLGCLFFGYGIQFGLIPDQVYRIYTQTRQETVDSWEYQFLDSEVYKPVNVDTNPQSPIALKYKKKTDEWTKDDFEPVRNMQVSYFGIPLSLAGLAVAFKISSSWQAPFQLVDPREVVVQNGWYFFLATFSAALFVCFVALYACKLIFYPKKVWKEWEHPLNSNGFAAISICIMLYAFLMYDRVDYDSSEFDEESTQQAARIFFWIGAVPHAMMTVVKMGEWVGCSLELEHVYPHWMMMPVGLAVAALVDPIVGAFAKSNGNSEGNHYVARFFYSIALLMWITLFVVTFFKTVTTPSSDDRNRHGIWIWLAAPCVLGLADFVICCSENQLTPAQCANQFSNFYFVGIFIFLSLAWSTMPHLNFFGRDSYNAGYWIECFALDTLAACACLFYTITGFEFGETTEVIFLTIASIANLVAFLHFIVGIIRRRGVFTPEVKWGPLSFMKLTHEAIRGNLPMLQQSLELIDVDDISDAGKDRIGLFAVHFHRFVILHEEHSKHEDEVIFKMFNDFFPAHAKKYNEDHAEDHERIAAWCKQANVLLDVTLALNDRKQALDELKNSLPRFFEHLKRHLKGEEDNLNPIGRKYIPLAMMKEMSREVWKMTPAEKWEVIVPFIVINLPRHMQRVRYLKVLTWSMPERAQQIGAIVYRNVDAVTWERLRTELPEIIPRGAPNWKRYF